MNNKIRLIISSAFISVFLIQAYASMAQEVKEKNTPLSVKEQRIIRISALTAQGKLPGLRLALQDGLNAGLTINEAKEILVQLYAYAGFPRSLNALHVLMAVLEERTAKGISDPIGRIPAPYPAHKDMLQVGAENQFRLVGTKIGGGVYEFAPTIDRFLKEHLFGHIFGRDNLDWRTRELVTIAALASMEAVTPQLRSHYAVGMRNGITPTQLTALIAVLEHEIDQQLVFTARGVLHSVLDNKPFIEASHPFETLFPVGEKVMNGNFVGTVWLNQLVQSDSTNDIQVGNVTFEPGARSKWHYHAAGQILLAMDGIGYYQEKGKKKRLLRKGDTVTCPPNVPHWHGASPGQPFVQIAITNYKHGGTVWLDVVSESDYNSEL